MPGISSLTELTSVRVEEADDRIWLVTLDRPDRLNAITPRLVDELTAVVDAADLDRELRAVVLTGAGRGFCAGLDLHGSDSTPPGADGTGEIVGRFMGQDHIATLNERIHRSRKPWIAAVNGPCVGGGLAIALACDIRVTAESATFGAVFLKIGVSNCDMGTSYFLPRLVGASRCGRAAAHRGGSSMPAKPPTSVWWSTWWPTGTSSTARSPPLA